VLAQQLVVLVAEQLLRVRVGEDDPAVEPGSHGRVGQALEHRAQRRLTPAQTVFETTSRFGVRHININGCQQEGFQRLRLRLCVVLVYVHAQLAGKPTQIGEETAMGS
jgi:hypothetical protein